MNTGQKFVAEFLGVFTLVFAGAGSICADAFLRSTDSGGVGLLGIALAHGLALVVMISAMGHISGGHFNPAITLGFWVTKKLGTVEAITYWVAQLAGGIAAAFLLTVILPEDVWRNAGLGTPELARDFSRTNGMILEAIATFFLVWVVFGTAADSKSSSGKFAGVAIGLTVTMGILFAGPFTGAALNPARAFGPALIASKWLNHGVYWVGPLFGGFLAGLLYNTLYLRKQT